MPRIHQAALRRMAIGRFQKRIFSMMRSDRLGFKRSHNSLSACMLIKHIRVCTCKNCTTFIVRTCINTQSQSDEKCLQSLPVHKSKEEYKGNVAAQ